MAAGGRPSITKRQRESARKEWQVKKAERRAQRDAQRKARAETGTGEDPDLAGIVPGPQPLRDDD